MKRNAKFAGPSGTREDVRRDHDRRIQTLVADSLEGKSRKIIAQQMTAALHWEVTASMLDNFSAGGKVTARFPASLVSAFCDACGDDRIREELIGARLSKLVEFARRILKAAHERRELHQFAEDSLAEARDKKELRLLLNELLEEEGTR